MHVLDLFGGGKVEYSTTYGKWRIRPNRSGKPHVIATLRPPIVHSSSVSVPDYTYMLNDTHIQRIHLGALMDVDVKKKRKACAIS
jgi:hypothetical protein